MRPPERGAMPRPSRRRVWAARQLDWRAEAIAPLAIAAHVPTQRFGLWMDICARTSHASRPWLERLRGAVCQVCEQADELNSASDGDDASSPSSKPPRRYFDISLARCVDCPKPTSFIAIASAIASAMLVSLGGCCCLFRRPPKSLRWVPRLMRRTATKIMRLAVMPKLKREDDRGIAPAPFAAAWI